MTADVRIVEVGPRDGLQNERRLLPAATKVALVERLAAAGLREIEATAFVSPRWVPQMADAAEVLRDVPRRPGVRYAALVPNLRGLEAALAAGADEVAVFGAASETFSRRNVNASIDGAIARFVPVVAEARRRGVPVRGYVSCAIACPYEGDVAPARVAEVAARLQDLGCREISLGDTIGAGTPSSVSRLLEAVLRRVPAERLAGHFHDTHGLAPANVVAAHRLGLRAFDASVAGLGGCPYAPGAAGNVATEDVAVALGEIGVDAGVDVDRLLDVAGWIAAALGRVPASRAWRARRARPEDAGAIRAPPPPSVPPPH